MGGIIYELRQDFHNMRKNRYIAYSGEEDESAIKNYFLYFLEDLKMGLIICITGNPFLKTGTGKSWTALRIAELIDPRFDATKDVVYSVKDYLKVMDRIQEEGYYNRVVILDEAEITVSNRKHYSLFNKILTDIAATNRYLRVLTIVVCPQFSSIDKRLRYLISHWGYCEKVKTGNGHVKVFMKFYRMITDLFGDKIYRKKLVMYNRKAGKLVEFQSFKVNKPSEKITKPYEEFSRKFKENHRKELERDLLEYEAASKVVYTDPENIIETVLKSSEELQKILSARGLVSLDLIKRTFNTNFSDARIIKDTLDKNKSKWKIPEIKAIKVET